MRSLWFVIVVLLIIIVGSIVYVYIMAGYSFEKVSELSSLSTSSKYSTTPSVVCDKIDLVDVAKVFGFDLYRYVVKYRGYADNIVVSPYNLFEALLMLYEGSNTTTREEIANVLGIDSRCDIWVFYSKLRNLILEGAGNATLELGSGIWIRDRFYRYVRHEYIENLVKFFKSIVREFSKEDELVNDVNSYIENKTHGLIKRPLRREMVDFRTVVLLVTTLYFKAFWEKPFRPTIIVFESIEGSMKEVQGMERYGEFYVYEDNDLVAVAIPYKNSSYEFLIFMPKKIENFKNFVENLSIDKIHRIIEKMKPRGIELAIPKFEIETKLEDIHRVLEAMGIREVFKPYVADLTKMANVKKGDIYVDRIIHAAKIKVYEKGTEAAAATIIIIKETALRPSIVINKPFVFMIIHKDLELPLFIGQITSL